MNGELKEKIYTFLNEHEHAVISTIDTNKQSPESAVVGFAQTNELQLIFGTANFTRKYANIMLNPHVSFVIGWEPLTGTIQYEGIAKELDSAHVAQYTQMLVTKNVDNQRYIGIETQRYFLVEPSWIRFVDNGGNPPKIHEFTF